MVVPLIERNGQRVWVRRFGGPQGHVGILDGLRVAHVTDLHVGLVTPLEVQLEAAERANDANPDLIVMTGDFVCHSQAYLEQLTEVIGAYEAPVIAVLGNHDYWSGAAEVRRYLLKAGAEILDNAHTTITLRHQRLQVLGLDDAYTGHADPDKALKGLRPDLPTLGLSHIAEEADRLWYGGVPLVLSGHTHAGQITLARFHELSIGHVVGHRYVHGLYGKRNPRGVDDPRGAVYVGAGIGASVFPFRVGDRARREVTLFDLGKAPGSMEEPLPEQLPLPGRPVTDRQRLLREMKVARRTLARERRRGRDSIIP
ncbi:MAG: metallophosphoesterase [Myxococcales bacterium]|nr:metallophosphoesterase [Myxococcales bacterium]